MREYHYNVLFTTVARQDDLCKLLRKSLPEGRGTAFCPMMETYRRDAGKNLVLKPMFPGYVFIRSDLKVNEFHDIILAHRADIMTYIGELAIGRRKVSGEYGEHTVYEDGDIVIPDLSEKETEFLDILLDFDRTGGEVEFGTIMEIHKRDPEAAVAALVPRRAIEKINTKEEVSKAVGDAGEKMKLNKTRIAAEVTDSETSAAGILRMSYGYKEPGKKRWKVMEGPLRALEDHIVDVNTHNKKAYLDFSVNDRVVRAGFEALPKKRWFPDEGDDTEMLEDGTEIDLDRLKRSMMSLHR